MVLNVLEKLELGFPFRQVALLPTMLVDDPSIPSKVICANGEPSLVVLNEHLTLLRMTICFPPPESPLFLFSKCSMNPQKHLGNMTIKVQIHDSSWP